MFAAVHLPVEAVEGQLGGEEKIRCLVHDDACSPASTIYLSIVTPHISAARLLKAQHATGDAR